MDFLTKFAKGVRGISKQIYNLRAHTGAAEPNDFGGTPRRRRPAGNDSLDADDAIQARRAAQRGANNKQQTIIVAHKASLRARPSFAGSNPNRTTEELTNG